MSFISNKILHSVSTMQNMIVKQDRRKSRLSSSFLNAKISPKVTGGNGSKESLNWATINENRSFPLANIFAGHNNMIAEEIQASLTELQIVMDRIQNKAMNEQASIEVIYKQLKELQRIIMAQMKQIESSSQQLDKEQMKNILLKLKTLFSTVSQKQSGVIEFKQPINYFKEEQHFSQSRIDQTFPRLFQNETKERQRQWEQQIDTLSQVMFELQSQIHYMRNQSIQQHKIFQEQIKTMQISLTQVIVVEKQITNYEHDVILQLIKSAGEKVAYL